MNIGSFFGIKPKATQKTSEAPRLAYFSVGSGKNLAPLEQDTVTILPKNPSKAPVHNFSSVAMGILPFYAKDTIAAMKATDAFENNEITHHTLQDQLVRAGVKPDNMPAVFQKITMYLPGFEPKQNERATGSLYRFIGREEFEKLLDGKPIEANLAYNGNCFDVTTNPTLNHNDFARVKFKKTKDSENVELHDADHDYYRLNQMSYSIDDVEEIDRIFPNGYQPVYKARPY